MAESTHDACSPDPRRLRANAAWHGARISRILGAAERALWAAILTDAVDICVGKITASAEETTAARRWVEEAQTQFGGFTWCCDLLGLDDDAIRERILPRVPRVMALRRMGCRPGHDSTRYGAAVFTRPRR